MVQNFNENVTPVALVTGGSRGIGKEIAKKFSRKGWYTIICSRKQNELRSAICDITNNPSNNTSNTVTPNTTLHYEYSSENTGSSHGGTISVGDNMAIVADVSKEKDVKNMVYEIINKYGKIDVLVNNAGIVYPVSPSYKVDTKQWVNNIHINLVGTFYCTRHVLPYMIKRNYGKIINITSSGAFRFFENQTAYCSSKTAIIAFTQTIVKELSGFRIDVNALAPSAIKTRLIDDILEKGELPPDIYNRAKQVKEKGGYSMDDVTEFAKFLGSEESDGLSGKTFAPRWDDLDQIKNDLESIKRSDRYTIGRIE